MAPTLVTQFASTGAATTHNIPLTGKTVGKDVFVLFQGMASVTAAASPWVEDASTLSSGGDFYIKLWRLPAASNTAGITTLAITLSVSRPLSAIVWEDKLHPTNPGIFFGSVTTTPGTTPPTSWVTGTHTYTQRIQSIAFFAGGSNTNFSTWDQASYDEGFADFADSGVCTSATDFGRIWLAQRADYAATNTGVTATGNGVARPGSFASGSGLISYNTDRPGPRVVSNFATATDSASVSVPLTGKTDGKDVFFLFGMGATPSAVPSPWVELGSYLAGGGQHYVKLWHLPAASNTSGVTTLSFTLNAGRAVAGTLWEDDLKAGDTPYFTFVNNGPTGATPALWGTGLHTFGVKSQVFACFFYTTNGGTVGSWDLVSYDHSFADFADSGNSLATASARLWMGHAAETNMANDGVSGTSNGAFAISGAGAAGFVAYNNTATGVSAYAEAIVADGADYYWRMGSATSTNVLEEIAGLRTLISTTPGPAAVAGALGGDSDAAKQFSGVANQTTLSASNVNLSAANGTPITFECWCWIDSYVNDDRTLFEYNSTWHANTGSFGIDLGNSTGGAETNTVSIGYRDTTGASIVRSTFPQSALPTASWHHLVIIVTPDVAVSAANKIKVYIDGAVVTVTNRQDTTTASSTLHSAAPLVVGARGANLLMFAGRIDELAIYKKALTTGEIADHYALGIGGANRIVTENLNTGELASVVAITGAGDAANQGFARPFSLNRGNTVNFACNGPGVAIDIYRIGYYGGLGWCKKTRVTNTPATQPEPATISNSNGGTTCAAWTNTASWAVPSTAVPGLYVGVFRNVAENNASYIPFVVRDDSTPADIMYKLSDTTWAGAYNAYGTNANPFNGNGKCLYGLNGVGNINDRSYAVSYERPIVTRQNVGQTYWLACEAPLIHWLERNGYDVTYSASRDWRETAGAPTLAAANIYISSGHDEYWSQGMRDKWVALRDAGKHLLFMSGNEAFWRIRFPDESTIWCYKDTMVGPTGSGHTAGTALDPVTWTGTWKDTRSPNDATRAPEHTLTGTDFRMNGVADKVMAMTTADAPTAHAFWRDTDVPTAGITSGAGLIGFEADERKPTRPVGSYSFLAISGVDCTTIYADDNGESYTGTKNPMNWAIVAQRWPSGALTVGFGTCQWSWGLDGSHDRGTNISSSRIQQATMNLLADLGALPDSKQSALVLPTPVDLDAYGLTGGFVPISTTDIEYRLSGGASNTNPNSALGGAMSTVSGGLITSGNLHNLFDIISGTEAAGAQIDDYRCIYVKNIHSTLTWLTPKVWVKSLSSSADTELAIALGGEGVGGTAETVANENTPPSGESFSTPTTKGAGLAVADVAPGQAFPLWIRRRKNSAAGAASDTATLRVEGDSNP